MCFKALSANKGFHLVGCILVVNLRTFLNPSLRLSPSEVGKKFWLFLEAHLFGPGMGPKDAYLNTYQHLETCSR